MPIRVVLDTNCIISALVFSKGNAGKLRELWKAKLIIPVTCRETALELFRVLAYPKFNLDQGAIEALIADFIPYAEICQLEKYQQPKYIVDDPDDEIFLRLAECAGADFLVSGDKHLLSVKAKYPELNIITIGEFVSEFEAPEI